MGWWRRLRSLSDERRARLLAYTLGALILLLVYALGGVSLYVRDRYLASGAARALHLHYRSIGTPPAAAGDDQAAGVETPAQDDRDEGAAPKNHPVSHWDASGRRALSALARRQ